MDDLSTFTSVAQFDEVIEGLRAEPTAENLRLLVEVIEARAAYAAAVEAAEAAEAAAQAAAEDAAEEAAADDDDEDEEAAEGGDEAEAAADEVEIDEQELVAAAASKPLGGKVDKAATGGDGAGKPRHRAKVVAPMGQTWTQPGELMTPRDIATHMNKAVKGEGSAGAIMWNNWDRSQFGPGEILHADMTAGEQAKVLGVIDRDGRQLDPRKAKAGSGSLMKAKVHRAACAGCNECANVLDQPDAFMDYGEPFGDSFDMVPADGVAWNGQATNLSDLTLDAQVYVYCGLTDDEPAVSAAGILQEDGTVIPIDPADDETWKTVIDITVSEGDKTKYSLEEYPILFRVPRNADFCDGDTVTRKINKYLALHSRFIETRRLAKVVAEAKRLGYWGEVVAPVSDAGDDFVFFLNAFLAGIEHDSGVDLDGSLLAVPQGFQGFVNARRGERAPIAQRLNDTYGIERIVEMYTAGSPFAQTWVKPAVAALAFDLAVEQEKTFSATIYDPSQWRKPVGETTRIGVTDTFRDMSLAQMNSRGVVIYRDEALVPVGAAGAATVDITLCASGSLPGRVDLQCAAGE